MDGAAGLSQLSDRELDVLRLIANGLSNDAIALSLSISRKTVEAIVRSIFLKLGLTEASGINRRVMAAVRYHEHGPAVRSARLPVRLTTFVGRAAELADIERQLANHRTVSVIGIGGCGKTSLAVEFARRQSEAGTFVVFADLVSASNRSEVVASVCDAAGVVASTEPSGLRRIARVLEGVRALLVLDNTEHVAAAVTRIVEQLAAVSDLSILVTSRRALGTTWERSWGVPPLSAADAASLCLDRAGGVMLDEQRAAICGAADGIPLAIELLAAQCQTIGAASVIQRLSDVDLLLSRGGTDRHASLQRILSTTFETLSPPAQRLLSWLSVFPGGLGMDQLEAISDGVGGDTLVSLQELYASGLLQRDDETRYRLLEPIRHLADGSLARRDETAAAEQALIRWALQFVRDRAWGFIEADNGSWRASLTLESANTDAGYAAALRRHDHTAVLDLLGGLAYYWSRHRPMAGRARAAEALAAVVVEGASRRHGWALLGLALLEENPARRSEWIRSARARFHDSGDHRSEAVAAFHEAQDSRSVAAVDEARELAKGVGASFFEGWLLVRKAALLHRDGRPPEQVLSALAEAERLGRSIPSAQLLGGALLGRSAYRLACEESNEVVAADLDEATALIGTSGDPGLWIEVLCMRLQLHTLRGHTPAALEAARQVTSASQGWLDDEVVTDRMRVARVVLLVAAALQFSGEERRAEEILAVAGELDLVIAPHIQTGERYPIASSIVSRLQFSPKSPGLTQLAEALKRADEALGACARHDA